MSIQELINQLEATAKIVGYSATVQCPFKVEGVVNDAGHARLKLGDYVGKPIESLVALKEEIDDVLHSVTRLRRYSDKFITEIAEGGVAK